MRREVEQARAGAGRTSELAELVREAQARLDEYRRRPERGAMTSHAKILELEHARDLAAARLERAQGAEGPAAAEGQETGAAPEGAGEDEGGDEGGSPARRL